MSFKVISGGQTGIDILGVKLAKEIGLETGGTIGYSRNHYITECDDGINRDVFNFTKTGNIYYPYRTEQNVINSDGTVYFATDADTAGYWCTKKSADKHRKPFLLNPTDSSVLLSFIKENNIKILNVAGNRGSKLTLEKTEEATIILMETFDTIKKMEV